MSTTLWGEKGCFTVLSELHHDCESGIARQQNKTTYRSTEHRVQILAYLCDALEIHFASVPHICFDYVQTDAITPLVLSAEHPPLHSDPQYVRLMLL